MADTIRTKAELDVILRDNAAGEVSEQDVRDLAVSLSVHGEVGATNNSEITLGSGYQTADLDTVGASARGVTPNATTHQLTLFECDMKVRVMVEVCFLGASGQAYEFAVFRDGGPAKVIGLDRVLHGAGSTPVALCWSVLAGVSEDETIELAVKCNGQVFTLNNGLLSAHRVGVD